MTPPSAARRRRRASGLNRRAAASAVRRASAARAVNASTPGCYRPAWCIRGPNRIQSSIVSIAGRRSGSRSARRGGSRSARRIRSITRRPFTAATASAGAVAGSPDACRRPPPAGTPGATGRAPVPSCSVPSHDLLGRCSATPQPASPEVTGYVHLTGVGCNRSSGVPRCLGVSSRHGSGDRLRHERPRQRRDRRGTRRARAGPVVRLVARPPRGGARLPPPLRGHPRGLAPPSRPPRGRDDPRRARPGRRRAGGPPHDRDRRGHRGDPRAAQRRRPPGRGLDLLRLHRRTSRSTRAPAGSTAPSVACWGSRSSPSSTGRGTASAGAPTPRAGRSSGTGRRTVRAAGAR